MICILIISLPRNAFCAGGESVEYTVRTGLLTADESAEMRGRIGAILSGG